jgi:predicted Fe-Mo cluster-binding NifX family protein
MKVCMPISKNIGLDSPLHGHFGSAPGYLAVDTETLEAEALLNTNLGHAHGACNPVQVLAEAKPGAVLVAGLGTNALVRLRENGIRVYLAPAGTAGQVLGLFKEGKLKELVDTATCGGHTHGHSCQGHG